jgi:hypothetical protein
LTVPDPIRLGLLVFQGFGSTGVVQIVPAIKGGVRNTDLFQRPAAPVR